jgi:hypothetical protein
MFIEFLAELTVVLSVIFNTSLPCDDLHFTQYRVCKIDELDQITRNRNC